MEERKGRHEVSLIHVHLVFVTKRRGKVFKQKHINALKDIFKKVCTDFEVHLKEFNGENDHVHLLLNYPPKVCIAQLVNSLKGVSSRLLKKKFKDIAYFWSVKKPKNSLWSPSYFAGSVGGAPLSTVKQYIENQKTPDSAISPP